MVGTYLICDLCGNFGPPAGFVTKDGIRLCYQCLYQEDEANHAERQPSADETPTELPRPGGSPDDDN